jgi:hypothetical protein
MSLAKNGMPEMLATPFEWNEVRQVRVRVRPERRYVLAVAINLSKNRYTFSVATCLTPLARGSEGQGRNAVEPKGILDAQVHLRHSLPWWQRRKQRSEVNSRSHSVAFTGILFSQRPYADSA